MPSSIISGSVKGKQFCVVSWEFMMVVRVSELIALMVYIDPAHRGTLLHAIAIVSRVDQVRQVMRYVTVCGVCVLTCDMTRLREFGI